MIVRPVEQRDVQAWGALRATLWPDAGSVELAAECAAYFSPERSPFLEMVFVAETPDGFLVGFIEASLRSVAEGCTGSPVPYIEGWYVAPHARESGVGRSLVGAVEDWARARGFNELGSDALSDNTQSHAAHEALGFEEVEHIVTFRKQL